MNKPKQNSKNNNKKSLLIDGLYNYLKNNDEQLQLKPNDFSNQFDDENFSLTNKDEDLEEYKKDYSSRIDKQILIISQNIMNSLFGLNNEKFSAFMSRYNVWGFDLTMQQFINSFYLVVKTDNMLRQFVLDHMDKIITTTRGVMEKYLITHMSDFRFRETRTDYNKKRLLDKAKQNQLDIDKKIKDRDKAPVKQSTTSTTDETTTTPITTTPETGADIATTPITGQPELEMDNLNQAEQANEGQNRILSLNEIMNGTAPENQAAASPIEDNLSGVTPPQIPTPEELTNGNENEEQGEEEGQEEQSEQEAEMEQQILNNLRQEHPDLQKGLTTNG